MENETTIAADNETRDIAGPEIIEEIVIEELSIDGVCGVY